MALGRRRHLVTITTDQYQHSMEGDPQGRKHLVEARQEEVWLFGVPTRGSAILELRAGRKHAPSYAPDSEQSLFRPHPDRLPVLRRVDILGELEDVSHFLQQHGANFAGCGEEEFLA